ncbi:MAG: helix-turn-helix domain-containing protein [Bacteroidales bacterium]|jgi:AraC-like DNA-binding protein|nr:helix-turn-helix domain-containing protein [Bacteroidales bacterium]MCI2133001.1 helix-turn-helix domain-containing protein [Bacteroidales bacterium]
MSWAFISVLIVVAVLSFLYNRRVIREKNIVLARLIDELAKTRKEAADLLQENIAMKESLNEAQGDSQEKCEALENQEEQKEHGSAVSKKDLDKFHEIENKIIKEKLYLDPSFSKKEMLKCIGVNANKFAAFFKEVTGTSFTNYMQTLRLEHAANLMRKYPHWSLEAIAKDSCMSKSMFYDLFKKKFGINPSQYKKEITS